MSKKHEKRTRTQILAKRDFPIEEIPVRNSMTGLIVQKKVKAPSKYTPHFGKKQEAKLQQAA